jgi:hypothetical protein
MVNSAFTQRRSLLTILIAAAFLSEVGARQIVTVVTPDRVSEAIAIGADEAAAQRFLKAFVLQSHGVTGDAPLIGQFTTPFSRIVSAGVRARNGGHVLTPTDIPLALLAPEVHIIAVTQATVDGQPATVRSIALWRAGEEVAPFRTQDLNGSYREAFNVDIAADGIVGVFPAEIFAQASQVIVHFDKVAKGFSVISGCKDCVILLAVRQIR